MSEINNRIRKIVEQSGLNKSGFAKKINVTPSHISQMCSGAKAPSDRTIADICREFNVNETWLKTGEGEMYNEAPTDELDGILEKYGLPRELRELFIGYLKLSDSAKQEVCDLILRWANNVASAVVSIPAMAPVTETQATLPEDGPLSEEEIQRELAEYEALLRGTQRLQRQFDVEKRLFGSDSSDFAEPDSSGELLNSENAG